MSTITDGTTTLTPWVIQGRTHTRPTRTVVVDIVGGDESVTRRAGGLRRGQLVIVCEDEAAGVAMEQLHLGDDVLTLDDTDTPTQSMDYVPTGELTLELDPQGLERWLLTVPFQEV